MVRSSVFSRNGYSMFSGCWLLWKAGQGGDEMRDPNF